MRRHEKHFIEFMRKMDKTNFTVTIAASGGHCRVRFEAPIVSGSTEAGSGQGATFSEAWHDFSEKFLSGSALSTSAAPPSKAKRKGR